jgi:LuxR family maltose regulon positive regulatory protein
VSLPLLSTKFYLPPPRANAVPRPRLTEKLRGVLDRPGGVALLSGPAGFGKTTLLSEFLTQTPLPAAWLSLDEGDNDPVRFWTYLIRACQSVQAGVGEAALALFHAPQPPPDEAVPTLLINDLARLEGGLALVLDDFHTLQEASIHSAFALLVERLPANLRLIVSTRLDPPWPLARLRARDRLVEIRSQDLRFNSEETAAFLIQSMGLELSPEDVAALEERSEGWVAGLQLAAIALQSLALTLPETPAASFV